MKKFIFLLFSFLLSSVYAQQDMHWRAVYQYKRVLNEKQKARRDSLIQAQPAMAEMMKSFYKRFDNRTYFLDFTTNESVYKEKEKLSKGRSSMRILQDRLLYKNLQKKMYREKRPSFQNTYLIIDSLPDYHWKITGETKKIGDYTVIKAEGTEKIRKLKKSKDVIKEKDSKKEFEEVEKKVVAWFTPELPISNGPGKYWGLPGLIMEVNKDGEVILLKELIINPTKYNEIKKPEEGEKLNEKEYREKMKKERERMEKMYKNRRSGKNSQRISITL